MEPGEDADSPTRVGDPGDLDDLLGQVSRLDDADTHAVGDGWETVRYLRPRAAGQELTFGDLRRQSLRLAELYGGDGVDREGIRHLHAVAVCPGEVVARADPASGAAPAPGPHVELEAGEYRARRYGYLCFLEGGLAVRSPLWIDPKRLRVHWLVLDAGPLPVTPEMVGQCLEDLGVVEGVAHDRIASLSNTLAAGPHRRGIYLAAVGARPTHGQDARVELLVDLRRRAGSQRPDGTIDFRNVNFAPSVKAGQPIARRFPAIPGRDGRDVFGQPLPAHPGRDVKLVPGANVEVRSAGDGQEFLARADGVVRKLGDGIQVVELLSIGGDVDFHTGNLTFGGEVFVSGSVARGFSIRADADVTIAGTVEAGATVVSGGDVTVGGGILGRKACVRADGDVRTAFVQEATVRAGGDLEVGNYAYHCRLFAGGAIRVRRGEGARGGSILGGEAWGRRGIETFTAGTESGMRTLLVAGLSPGEARDFDRVERGIAAGTSQVQRLLDRFDLKTIDTVQIRNLIRAATGPTRKLLVTRARQLGELAQTYQRLLGHRQQLLDRMSAIARSSEIRVWDRIYAGAVVRVGELQHELHDDLEAPRFHIRDARLVCD